MAHHLRRALGTTALAVLVGGAPGVTTAVADQTFDTEHHGVRVETVAEGLVHP
jgi:hypothetical protein